VINAKRGYCSVKILDVEMMNCASSGHFVREDHCHMLTQSVNNHLHSKTDQATEGSLKQWYIPRGVFGMFAGHISSH
jgi:hypothetical protein